MNDKTFIARGLLAGMCIAAGGSIYLKLGGVAGAVLFSFGLIAVVSLGLNLFTGKAQFVWGRQEKGPYAQGGYVWLFSILALNILGCFAMGLLMGSGELQEAAVGIIDKRLASSPLRNALLAIGCGFIMTLAVQGTARGKWLPLLFGIPAFIICGFPHCVADAFYIACLPGEYMAEQAVPLAMFYIAIVAGNFIGCNAYRLIRVTQPEKTEATETKIEKEPA